jgi:hypothetical protein
MEQAKKDALKVQALTQSLAQKVAQYEEQIADFRAEASMVVETLQQQLSEAQARIAELEAEGEVSEEAGPDADSE